MSTRRSIVVGGVAIMWDRFECDALVKPPGPGERFERKEPGTQHYFLNDVEVFRCTPAPALRLMEQGWKHG